VIISVEDLKAVCQLPLYQAAKVFGLRKPKLKALYAKHGINYKKLSRSVRDEPITREWLEENKHRPIADQLVDLDISRDTFCKYRKKFGIKDETALSSDLGTRFIKSAHGGCENCKIIYGYQIYYICGLCQDAGGYVLCEFRKG